MKKYTLFAALSMLALVVVAQGSNSVAENYPTKLRKNIVGEMRSTSPQRIAEKMKLQSNETPEMLPRHEEEWLYERNNWKKYGDYYYSYDNRGNTLRRVYDDGETAVATDKVYNENNKYIESVDSYKEGDGEFVNSDRRVLEYDTKVADFVTNSESYQWQSNEWRLVSDGHTYKKVVNRNEKGKVTGVEIYTYFQEEYHLQMRSTITYNADGLAEEFKYEELNFNAQGELEMLEVYTLKNLTWYKTDGQIMVLDDVTAFFAEGNNRLRKASYYKDGRKQQMFEATYEDNGDYTCVQTSLVAPIAETVVTYTTIDDNGSSQMTIDSYEDANSDFALAEDELVTTDTLTVTKNQYGVVVKEHYVSNDEILYSAKYDYTYHEEYGSYPVEQVFMEYDFDEADYVPFLKIVGNDFIDVAAVNQPYVDSTSGERVIYNLSGLPQYLPEEKLPAGIYIVREGSKVTKKLIK